jgi:general secretion pathway protein A
LLEGYRSHGRQPVILLDEAHLLAPEMLQEIRFILNFHFDSVSPISFALVGQPELRGKLRLAGAARPIFSEHAVQTLAALTRGIPRLLNAYCVNCLLDACTHDQKVVDEANVRRVAAEFDEPDRATVAGW